MHLLLENVMKGLLELWSGSFKAQTTLGNSKAKSKEPYVIAKQSWDDMDTAVASSGKLIPSAMIGSIVSVSSRWRWTAETHLSFLITLGPIILKDHLAKPYFDHFLDLSALVKKLIGLSIDITEDLPYLEAGLRQWVVDRLISTLPDPSSILDFMENRVSRPNDFSEESGQEYSCHLSGSLEGQVPWNKYHSVLARYLTTLYYNDRDMRAGTLRAVAIKDVEKLDLKGWNSLRCHPDFSSHKYCCGYGGRAERHHGGRKARFSQMVDLRANIRRQDALFESEAYYGQIQLFIEFTWDDERTILAIVQPWEAEPWIPPSKPPMRLLRGKGIQAVKVKNLLAPAGRVLLQKGKVEVAFDTSEGEIEPDLVDEQDVTVDASSQIRCAKGMPLIRLYGTSRFEHANGRRSCYLFVYHDNAYC
ncbi:hypothetical protein QFC20_006622 [Naganishia adeliensis]|uniref:Uncharacterized protein n=1 Tax=Naganishia adeliensis TaxID=92952 RepID=A0ACC2V894_9TREE|nr:hypothetical protein QFC20_006622 [Naganishia adeliensis]